MEREARREVGPFDKLRAGETGSEVRDQTSEVGKQPVTYNV
jgi:hypothetical protein